MTDLPSQIEWYLARDGQQHGPLSENEMRAFVDLGHLRQGDLIWRAGFPDWRPAPEVFAIHATPPVPAPMAPPTATEPVFDPTFNSPSNPARFNAPTASEPAAEPAGVAHAPAAEWHTPAVSDALPQSPGYFEPQLTSPDQLFASAQFAAPATAADTSINRHVASQPFPRQPITEPQPFAPEPQTNAAWPQPAQTRTSRPGPRPATADSLRPQAQSGQPATGQRLAHFDPDDSLDDDHEEFEPKRRLGAGRIAAALFFALLIGGGMAAILKRDALSGLLPITLAKAGLGASAGPATPIVTAGASAESVDQSFQRSEIWRHIKQEFPEWYAERVQEATKFAAEKRGEGAISKHLTESLVALRRKHADQALSASPERLKFVAAAFLGNLQAMAKNNVGTCYGFISQGETFPAVLEMMQQPEGGDNLQKQVVAVFQAIADGRKAPQSYLSPRKTDYDALAAELNTRGWTENDLRTFSDPRALGRATPEQVCRMVQDWFAAQIAIKDQDAQLRLLVESLRPVVAG